MVINEFINDGYSSDINVLCSETPERSRILNPAGKF